MTFLSRYLFAALLLAFCLTAHAGFADPPEEDDPPPPPTWHVPTNINLSVSAPSENIQGNSDWGCTGGACQGQYSDITSPQGGGNGFEGRYSSILSPEGSGNGFEGVQTSIQSPVGNGAYKGRGSAISTQISVGDGYQGGPGND